MVLLLREKTEEVSRITFNGIKILELIYINLTRVFNHLIPQFTPPPHWKQIFLFIIEVSTTRMLKSFNWGFNEQFIVQ